MDVNRRTALERRTPLERGPGPRRKSAPRRTQPERDWTEALYKVEDACCRLCDDTRVDAAHVIARACDRPSKCEWCGGRGWLHAIEGAKPVTNCHRCNATGYTSTLYVHPDSVIPLCRAHHTAYDDHQVDVLPVLTLEEQLRAVEDAGGIENARRRTAPSQYRRAA